MSYCVVVQPRLLVTAVDIAEGIAVTFDSYKKSDGKRKTVYYPGTKYGHRKQQQYKDNNNDKNSSKPVVIEYKDGITLEHVMASSTPIDKVPDIVFDFLVNLVKGIKLY